MTENGLTLKTSTIGQHSQLDLEERNEYLKEELKVCRKKIEDLEAEMARLTDELRIAEQNELVANREVRELRNHLAEFSSLI
jgi:hypothetical protein